MLDVDSMQFAVFNVYLLCNGSVTNASYDADIEISCYFIYNALLLVNLENGAYIIGGDFNWNSVGMACEKAQTR